MVVNRARSLLSTAEPNHSTRHSAEEEEQLMLRVQSNPRPRWLSTYLRRRDPSLADASAARTPTRLARTRQALRRSSAIVKVCGVLAAVIALPFLFETTTGCGFQSQPADPVDT